MKRKKDTWGEKETCFNMPASGKKTKVVHTQEKNISVDRPVGKKKDLLSLNTNNGKATTFYFSPKDLLLHQMH